jgi:hypothetical protein
MKQNMGFLDKLIRIIVALVIAALYFTHKIEGISAIILIVIGAIFLVTSLVNFCPLYSIFGLSTQKKNEASKSNQ